MSSHIGRTNSEWTELRCWKNLAWAATRALASFTVSACLWGTSPPTAPIQPIPFSHRQHVALRLTCKDCHSSAEKADQMILPAASKCMACHVLIAKDKPAIQKLTALAKSDRTIAWQRVYTIPTWVHFSHRVHLDAGAKCETCHGPVNQRDVLWKERDLTMDGCMDCHRKNDASLDCSYCHEGH